MRAEVCFPIALYLTVGIIRPYYCGKLKIFQSNGRISGVTETQTVRSLSECAVLFEKSLNSHSFNFNPDNNICELSINYPEGFTSAAEGWKVYAKIVDGTWSNWVYWGSCSVTCDDGTRTRTRSCSNPSPSNGGKKCPGQSTEIEICNEKDCYKESDYFIGENFVTWTTAKAACETMSARLVILDSQEEIDFLQTLVTGFGHWIGLRCDSGTDCTWLDGKRVEDGFKAWAPGQPTGRDCVWIGWYGNKWDDDYCGDYKKYICEFL